MWHKAIWKEHPMGGRIVGFISFPSILVLSATWNVNKTSSKNWILVIVSISCDNSNCTTSAPLLFITLISFFFLFTLNSVFAGPQDAHKRILWTCLLCHPLYSLNKLLGLGSVYSVVTRIVGISITLGFFKGYLKPKPSLWENSSDII